VARLQALAPAVAGAVGALTSPRAIVLVDSLLHGLALAELLPDWPLLADRAGPSLHGLTEEQRQRVEAGRAAGGRGPPPPAAPAPGMQPLALAGTAGVPRPAAGPALPPRAEGKRAGRDSRPARPLLLVDIDARHPRLRKRAQQRRRAYD